MDEVNHLVLAPFHDIVEKAKTAENNASDDEPILRAAQSLVREAERALKKLDPLCQKSLQEHKSNFVRALKENDDLTKYRTELNDLLWDFDDYIQADTFELDKFTQLQALSRKTAPQVCDILMRLKVESPTKSPATPHRLSPPTSPLFPFVPQLGSPLRRTPPAHPPPNTPLPPLPTRARTVTSSPKSSAAAANGKGINGAITHKEKTGIVPLGQHESQSEMMTEAELATGPPPRHPDRPSPPAMPAKNPWATNSVPLGGPMLNRPRPKPARRPIVPQTDFPVPSDANDTSKPIFISTRSSSVSSINGSGQSNSPPGMYTMVPAPLTTPRSRSGTMVPAIPEHNVADAVPRSASRDFATYSPVSPASHLRQISEAASVDSDTNGSVGNRDSAGPSHNSTRSSATSMSTAQSQPGIEVASISKNGTIDQGLTPVESDDGVSTESTRPTQRDCSLRADSSFYLAGGFCAGALEVARGGIGVKKTKKPVSCMYELDFREIERDVNRQDSGTYKQAGIAFRLRFLQKSHIAAKRSDDTPYGCLFCVQAGCTTDESDATLFFTQKQLMEHIARHPRPLPQVPGLTIVDAEEVPSHLRNDFDIHFMNPPTKHDAKEQAIENAILPVGISREPVRKLYGQRLLPDKTRALELAMGSRVTALTWPEKYNGEWCLGWHDGVYASVPTNCLRLDAPPAHEIKVGGISMIQAKTRWKFRPQDKDAGDWLKFDKNETITSITWAYIDHWCWSGFNAKGKWGIFPQAFIDSSTIEEVGSASVSKDRAEKLSSEKAKSTGMLGKFSLRRTASARPPSVVGSLSSHDTGSTGDKAFTSTRVGRIQDFMFSGPQ